MNQLKDIQNTLDLQVRKQAEKDFKAAISQATKLLEPFFRPMERLQLTNPAYDERLQQFRESMSVSRYGYIKLLDDYPVPECYVELKQAEASEAFVKRVASLQAQLDELLECGCDSYE